MKKKILILLFIIIYSICFSSCKKRIGEVSNFEPIPVVNSLLVSGEAITVNVSFAKAPDSLGVSFCDNARVLLFEDNVFVDELQYNNTLNLYVSDCIAKENKTYTCNVIIPNFDTLYATTTIPKSVNIYNPQVNQICGYDDEGYPYPSISFSFNNNPNIDEFFEANLYKVSSYDQDYYYKCYVYKPSDPVILNEGTGFPVFSNNIIKDSLYQMEISYTYWNGSKPDDEYVFMLMKLSNEYYKYIKYLYSYYDYLNSIEEINIGILKPIYSYSNVKNGYGVFAGISITKTDTLSPIR